MTNQLANAIPLLAHHAARQLGWRPAEFWAATPAELVMALVEPAALNAAPLTRTDLEKLMERDGHAT